MNGSVIPGRIRRLKNAAWFLLLAVLAGGFQPRYALEQTRFAQTRLQPIPTAEFARLIRDFSEPNGYFRSDNLVSNETSYLHVVDKMKELGASGGAYIGVGPEQNFTYIAKIRPQIAFIVDIRRQAIIQHLMFKAIFHAAGNRSRFLSLLFSKPIEGNGPGADASAEELVAYFTKAPTSNPAYIENLQRIENAVERDFRFPLSKEDRSTLEYVYSAFRDNGFDVKYQSAGSRGFRGYGGYRFGGYGSRGNPWSYFPSMGDLILEPDLRGKLGHFLASRADYDFVRSLSERNRIIPVVGDFAGTRALPSIADYLKRSGYTVTAFYTSNVEQYLFDNGVFDGFAQNVEKLPVTGKSLFIRAYPNQRTVHPAYIPNHRLTTLLQKITVFLDDYRSGLYTDYSTLVRTHYISATSK